MIIDGKSVAATLHAATATHVAALQSRGTTPCLAIVLVGDDEPSRIYVNNKRKAAARVGIETQLHALPATTVTGTIIALLQSIAANPSIHGVIVQMPLPPTVDTNAVLAALPIAKDVDGLSPTNLGLLFTGQECFIPATPQGCMLLIQSVMPSIAGKHAVVIGRSRLVGKPMAHLLLGANATVSIAHSHTTNMADVCRTADIIVAAAGQPHLVQADWVKPGAVVIDVGITRRDGTLVGDVDFHPVSARVAAITPVPGGVGPMTIACLLKNTVYAAAKQTEAVI
jgi:methylenetetrahydrofolate dehydrogenase (NADP+)/methenyltetrahydrofolate cyclohydrolase